MLPSSNGVHMAFVIIYKLAWIFRIRKLPKKSIQILTRCFSTDKFITKKFHINMVSN